MPPATTAYDDVHARITALADSMGRSPVVGISGHGGAGKSTLAAHLLSDLGGVPEQVVRTDRFYAAGAGPHSGLDTLHDWPALLELLHRLRATPAPQRLVYSARTYDGTERTIDVPMPRAVVVEGIRLFRPETMPLLDLAVWIDLTPESAGRRAVKRNRAQGDSNADLGLWHTKWIPEGHAYAELMRPDLLADVVIAAAGPA